MGVRDLPQNVAIISCFATVASSSSSSSSLQWERYSGDPHPQPHAIYDSRPGKGGPVILQRKGKKLESSCRKHVCRDINGFKALISIFNYSYFGYSQLDAEPVSFQLFRGGSSWVRVTASHTKAPGIIGT